MTPTIAIMGPRFLTMMCDNKVNLDVAFEVDIVTQILEVLIICEK